MKNDLLLSYVQSNGGKYYNCQYTKIEAKLCTKRINWLLSPKYTLPNVYLSLILSFRKQDILNYTKWKRVNGYINL